MTNRHLIAARPILLTALVWAAAVSTPLLAGDLAVTRYFSGLWDQPRQENQGIVLQIVNTDDVVKNAVAYWFTYGDDLESAWFIGIGQVVGSEVILDLYTVSGIGFMQDDMPDIDRVATVGTMVLSFRNCNHGTASYDIGDGARGSGEFEIRKLAGLYHSRCSGGISDDTPGHAKPVHLEVELMPARDGISGKGKAKFWERADRSDFHVSAEGIADGDYDVLVCGASVAMLPVSAGRGEFQFRSPGAEGKALLTFDPRGCPIALHDTEGAVLSSGDRVLSPKTSPGQGASGEQGKTDLSGDLESTGFIAGAEGDAVFTVKMNSIEFDVEIRNVPEGLYAVDVAGVERGQIEVNKSGKGKLRFSDPQKEQRLALDFNPHGQLIEVRAGVDIVLEVFFPEG
jgi:hypothetical protein